MRDKTQKIETTFGQISIFNPSENKPESAKSTRGKKPVINDIDNSSKDVRVVVKSEKNDPTEGKKDEGDFFGLDPKELNYFDQQIVNDYKQAKTTAEQSTSNVSVTDVNKSDLNYIDDYYFNNNNSSLNPAQVSEKNITKKDLVNEFTSDGNYLDRQLLKATDDDQLGSIQAFKRKNVVNKSLKSSGSSVPLIQSNNLDAEKLKKARMNLKSNPNQPQSESEHKKLTAEVPDWTNLTTDEALKIVLLHICYHNEEEGVFAIDKPYGLPSIRGKDVKLSVSKLLPMIEQAKNLNYRLLMCNRLDEYTTGVMLFATNPKAADRIRQYYNENKIVKQYLAITKNVPEIAEGEINIPLIRRKVNGIIKTYLSPNYNEETRQLLGNPKNDQNDQRKNAITKYRVLDSNFKSSLIELQPKTGFQHQIRAHLSFGLGCPILGDHKYSHHVRLAPQKLPDEMLKRLKIKQSKVRYVPMHLHAYRIILPEFNQNSNVFITAKLPLHFLNNLKRLKLKF